MAKKYLVSVDSGTQSTRIMIFDTQGNRVASGASSHPELLSPRQGWHEHGKNDIWNAFCDASKKAFANFDGDPEIGRAHV
jgi:sugar (pentulose or hexulose) kinase